MASASHTIVIKSGESFTLPPGGELVFVSDPAGVATDCGDVPTNTYKCGYFFLTLDSRLASDGPMEEIFTTITRLIIGNTTYSMNTIIVIGQDPGTLNSVANLNAPIPDQALFSFKGTGRTVLASRQYISLYFTAPDTVFDTIEMAVDNRGSRHFYKPLDAACGQYPNNTDTDVVYDD